jgi:hypothetical protein
MNFQKTLYIIFFFQNEDREIVVGRPDKIAATCNQSLQRCLPIVLHNLNWHYYDRKFSVLRTKF